ncbi:MAG: cytochrome-like protein [Ramlibacter sp.]|nr:cytochrome-like protein [Ramlibacter sp.]
MNKLFKTLFAVSVACATSLASAQPATAPAQATNVAPATPAAGPTSPKSLEAKVAMCVGCHGIVGYKSSFPEVYRVPKIAGQSAKYIAAALNAYKAGDRKHPTMRGIAESLSDKDIADISTYYENLGRESRKAAADKPSREPNAQVSALLQKAACASCHGANMSKPIDPSYPKIAGQYADYLFVALKSYKSARCRRCRSRASTPIDVIPAQAGIQGIERSGRLGRFCIFGALVSRLRGNDGLGRRAALHALDVGLPIGRPAGALAFPEHLAQAFHGLVVRVVQ